MPDGTQVAEVPEAEVMTVKDYKSEVKPIWCPGCGDFGVLSATYKALASLQLPATRRRGRRRHRMPPAGRRTS